MGIFQKGLVHGFRQTMAIFPSFFLAKIGQEKVFYDILERKNAFRSTVPENIKYKH